MSRVTRWKVEKTKVKVVFRLQFHATHIPQPGWDKLFISFIPADSGKVTAKTTKANVRTGACKWGDPIYETTRLLQDIKTKKYDDKFYKLVIAMGSSRSSVLGEANVNLAHYADALKPSAVQLPLQGCDSGTILHVTIQLLTSKTGFREFELQREMREKGLHSTSDEPNVRRISSFEASVNDPMEKANTRGRFKELSPLEEVGVNEERAESVGGFDGSSTASESFYVEKQDTSSTNEIDSLKSMTSGDLIGASIAQSPQQEKDPRSLPLGSNDWSHGWGSDYSADNDMANVYEENYRLRRSLETAESSILELKLEVNSLRCHSDEIGIEAQRFSQQLATELASGERLVSEVSVLRSECANVKSDLERLKDSKLKAPFSARETVATTGNDALLQELQLRWLKGLRDMEDKVKVIQSKVSSGLHEKESSSFSSDLETLRAVLHDLKQGSGHSVSGLNLVKGFREINLLKVDPPTPRARLNSEFYQPDALLHSLDLPSLVPLESDSGSDHSGLKEFALIKEVGELKAEREALTRKMDQMECYYEALVQELEESQRQMVGELQNLRNEHSTCLYTISATKAEMENIHQEMNKQLIRFTEEKFEFESLYKDLERRAVAAEAALKRARLNYSIAVNQLQKDLELLSVQVLSMHETSENLIKQAFSDPPPASVLGYEEGMENKNLDAKELQATKLTRPQSQIDGVKKQQLGGEIVSEDLKRSLLLQKGLYQKVEEEVYEVHRVNVYLDIFSKTLQESLLDASAEFRLLKEKVAELTQDLEISSEAKELVMQRLRDAADEVHQLRGYKDACDSKCNELALQNHVLELKIENLTLEKISFSQKIAECETVIEELGKYKSKFYVCSVEKLELEDLLKKEMLENGNHQSKTAFLQEEMIALNSQFDEVVSVKENLHSTVNSLQSKLQNMVVDYDEKCSESSIWTENVDRGLGFEDLAGLVMRLEEFQRSSCEKILQLTGEKQALAQERDMVQMSLCRAEADNVAMRHKFEGNLKSIVDKLDSSGNVVQKLQAEVEALGNKLKSSSVAEEAYAQQNTSLLSAFDELEVELRQLMAKNESLGQEIRALESTSEELGSLKLVIADLTEAKDALALTSRDRDEESAKLNVELGSIRSSLQSLVAELEVEKSIKSKLEDEVTDLTSQLSDKHSELLDFGKQKSELDHLRQLVAELELEKSTIFRTLSDSENSLKAAQEECSSILSLEAQISELHEYSIASDVRHIFTQTQFESCMEELENKYFCVESKVNSCLATEAHYIEENTKLIADLHLLRSELDSSIAQNKVQLDMNSSLRTELDELKKYAERAEATSILNARKHTFEVERLECMKTKYEDEIDKLIVIKEELEVKLLVLKFKLDSFAAENGVLLNVNLCLRTELYKFKERTECKEATSEVNSETRALEVARLEDIVVKLGEEIDNLVLVNEEQEIKLLVLKFKLEEQKPQIALLEDHKRDLIMLQNKYDEITRKLSEQVLKTEEFKNLSIRLKEQKDKAGAETLQAREKRDEGTPPTVHESLRMVFIKEQCETKVQELQQHLSVSKRHNEEMLCKLQDVVDEVDNRKKAEASNLKRNEELGIRILELEADLQLTNSEKREIMKAYDLMKAEKECSSISLECCKEEKLELEASLQKCNEERSKLSAELSLLKELLESSKSAVNNQRDSGDLDHADSISDESLNRSLSEPILVSGDTNDCEEAEADCLSPISEADPSNALVTVQPKQDTPGFVNSPFTCVRSSQEDVLNGDTKHFLLVRDDFRGQSLRSSMDHLNKELEKMKYESLLTSVDDHQADPCLPGLQRELMQLNKVNEELGCIYPSFKEFPTKGNALERVLALEIELAEALQEKKKSALHFQSSFLKQHSDEEAVFKSFRDINELIGDMLEMKRRYSAVESELKEMHGRYSELSLQFAEVEGERQKLMMTLKTVRASRKISFSNRSSPTTRGSPL